MTAAPLTLSFYSMMFVLSFVELRIRGPRLESAIATCLALGNVWQTFGCLALVDRRLWSLRWWGVGRE